MKTAHFLKLDKTSTQDLSSGALSYTTNFGRKFKLEQVSIHFTNGGGTPVSVTETVTITLDSVHGAEFDVVLQEVTLVAESDFVYRPQGEANYQAGDEIKIQCTNANTTGVANVNVKTSEM